MDPRVEIWTPLAILGFALVIRLAAALMFPSAHYPDETFQALEQAHRYAFGYGIKPWEFEVGLRSAVLPGVLSIVFRVSDAIGLPLVPTSRFLLAALSLLPVAAIYLAGLRLSPRHAVVGAIAAATWCELVNFSFRPLTEALAAIFLLTALALVSFREGELPRKILVWTGMCLGLAVMLRIQFAPAALAIVLCLGIFRQPGQLISLSLGALLPIVTFGVSDWIVWGLPFHSPIASIHANIVENVASSFGTSPAYAYFGNIPTVYGTFVLLLVGFSLILRPRRYRVWLLTALVILVSHSFIAHKEYRFVFVVTSLLLVAAAFASADLLDDASAKWTRRMQVLSTAILAAGWIAASLASASTTLQSRARGIFEAEHSAFAALAAHNDLCGLLLEGIIWDRTPGYAVLRRNVPIYEQRSLPRSSLAYNYVLAPSSTTPRQGYGTVGCFQGRHEQGVCLSRREGACERDPALRPLTETTRLGDPRLKD